MRNPSCRRNFANLRFAINRPEPPLPEPDPPRPPPRPVPDPPIPPEPPRPPYTISTLIRVS